MKRCMEMDGWRYIPFDVWMYAQKAPCMYVRMCVYHTRVLIYAACVGKRTQ